MNKKLMIGLLVSGAVIFGGAMATGAAKYDEPTVNQKNQEMISLEKAKEIALANQAGLIDSIDLERKLGKPYYEVEIENDNYEYEFSIDAVSGEILSSKKHQEDDHNDSSNAALTAANVKMITAEEAVAIAEKEVSGKMMEVELEEEDGGLEYKIELTSNKGKAEVALDAVTGKILKVEYDD